MEWIETTGRTVEEAKQRALDELGIDESELEFEVVQEPKTGFLGRLGGSSAHVRARVRPISREKPDRRRSRGRRDQGGRRGRDDRGGRSGSGRGSERGRGERTGGERTGGERTGGDSRSRPRRPDNGEPRREENRSERDRAGRSEERPMSEVPIEEQAQVAADFARGLVEAFGLEADVRAYGDDDDHLRVEIDGADLGLLIGQQGATMEALRELVRTALQRETEGRSARVGIDVGGYGARRREALAAFARDLADKVIESGRAQVLEPMNPPDRKVVHDAVNDIDGVTTVSEGEEPRRRVVIEPV